MMVFTINALLHWESLTLKVNWVVYHLIKVLDNNILLGLLILSIRVRITSVIGTCAPMASLKFIKPLDIGLLE